ncbi:acetyl/propionyl/methylcrotonyl-CoA carboxylase subunit alpha [Rhodovibrio salinarum]|uniref:Acetyl/propionyl/methylcrotonyl-CoA carboxylase subunit alpha n=1 Tax=Rhodovibrio salinarum TaxID=1087 RepID=A0A934QKB7_9PROT|nr:acetyl/propionyl/methylcrotonyl-CoA carboxylase subunit alpha [Rhodovibrio salinarum]MBK1698464.1 acetyl/propionyl/methylcrotonyl-CoA carboxylase subunit alpha [Rhodovibrio salinarum]
MLASVLIANRGEIACRIIRTARTMGLRTVAVYSDADRHALHVALADDAVRLGPASAAESYLNVDALTHAIRVSGAESVHPGYGFLAENADFAEAVQSAGATWIGPPPAAIRAMGSKAAAKARMAEAGVPLVPGYHGDDQDPETLAREAEQVGYPLLIKASAGGGGKGMRVVERAEQFADQLDAAKRESKASFGDDRVLLERYLQKPRHIEVQVFADSHGNAVHLFERDCSPQRRHQKVLEEAPAPGMTAEKRAEMGAAAVAAAQAIGYVGAGTVEFIAEGAPGAESFYFMEMNTRLQVEHPVTEAITGQDLVAWQLRVASGEPLPLAQGEIPLNGHAVEVRLYAEDPARDFLPATGPLTRLQLPDGLPGVRVDTGVREGDTVTPHYDPMLAKLIAHGPDRATALRRLGRGLEATQVGGCVSNLGFLCRLVDHPEMRAGPVDTGFIARESGKLQTRPPLPDDALALAALAESETRARAVRHEAAASPDPHSPWHAADGWRLNDDRHLDLSFLDGEAEQAVRLTFAREACRLALPSGTVEARVLSSQACGESALDLTAEIGGRKVAGCVLREGESRTVLLGPQAWKLTRRGRLAGAAEAEAPTGSLTAPMPGKISQVAVEAGQAVARGQTLMVLEAMKMEHAIRAPAAGQVTQVHFAAGDQVSEGVELLLFEPAAETEKEEA